MIIAIGHMHFKIIENYREAFDGEQFAAKYSEVLNKYDYIVGDIGYEKLRMSGFYRDNKAKIERDKKFSAISDYINEYCNFGCAYFILQKLGKDEVKQLIEEGVNIQTIDLAEPAVDDSDEGTVASTEGAGAEDVAQEEKPRPPKERRKRPRRSRPKGKSNTSAAPKENVQQNNRTLSSLQKD